MPAGLGWLDHLLFLVLAVLVPISAGRLGFRRLCAAADEDLPWVRVSLYRNALVLEWVLVAALVVRWLATGRPWWRLGLVPVLGGGLAGVVAGLAIIVAVMARQHRFDPNDREALERARAGAGRLARMLPATAREFAWFAALSVTAGICEETLYRGYLIWYLGAWAAMVWPHQAFLAAAIGSSMLFGLGHAYQGPRNIVVTGLVGGFLAAVYWLTRSLFAGMLVHALMDLYSGYVGYRASSLARPAAAGANPEA